MVGAAFLPADWNAPPGLHALTSLRAAGDPSVVGADAGRLLAELHLPEPPRWLRQVHGIAVAIEPGHDRPEADAAVTRQSGVVLAVRTADCLPVVFQVVDGPGLAVAHAGWRGLAAGVLEATVAALAVSPDRIRAWLGPAAGPRAYEVGAEVHGAFVAADPGAHGAFLPTRPGHWLVDLYALARRRLSAVGVMDVSGGGLCTITEAGRFYSHRRGAEPQRMATLAWRDPPP